VKLGRCPVRGPLLLCFVRVSPAVQMNNPIACRTEARLSQPVCPVVPGRAGLAVRPPAAALRPARRAAVPAPNPLRWRPGSAGLPL
jgi:hypothetical protein